MPNILNAPASRESKIAVALKVVVFPAVWCLFQGGAVVFWYNYKDVEDDFERTALETLRNNSWYYLPPRIRRAHCKHLLRQL